MVVASQPEQWVAFEELRGPTEATTVVSEPKYGQSARRKSSRPSWSKANNSTNNSSLKSLPPPPGERSVRTPSSPSLSQGRTSRRPSSASEAVLNRRERSLSRVRSSKADSKPEVVQSRTASTGTTSTHTTQSSRSHNQIQPADLDRGRELLNDRDRPPIVQVNTRGRSRGRSRDVPRSIGTRPRSLSKARSTTTSRTSRTAPGKRERGRSSSRSRLPPVSASSRQRARSRSASLTRVTSPAVSPAAKSSGAPTPRDRSRSRPPPTNIGRQLPSPASTGDANIGRDIWFGRAEQPLAGNDHKGGIMEKLFGDQVKNANLVGPNGEIRPRTLLAATVYHNTATNLWITTINTNQRGVAKNPTLANKFLKAFSFQSEREARESAIANAPPKMVAFSESPNCYICDGKFAVFRRASHCRNCGVCICSNCTVQWSSKMIPDTYNLKNEAFVKICKTCDMLSTRFKHALLSGNYEEAIALYGTGNINLRTPFPVPNKKGEVLYPIHCAVQGGNLDIVRWLIEDHFCPVKLIRTGVGRKAKRGVDALILTSKGRSVLSIAIERLKVDVMRYLVVDCAVSIFESTDLQASLRALEAALTSIPPKAPQARPVPESVFPAQRWDRASFDDMSEPSSLGTEEYVENESVGIKSNHTRGSRSDACIICYEQKINCVATPCGHQVCCLECSANLNACPVCTNQCEFIKIFRP